MDVAKKLLSEGRAEEALERLKSLLPTVEPNEQWRVHELIGAAFHDLAEPDGAAQAYFNAAQSDRYLRAQRQHCSNYLFALHYLPSISFMIRCFETSSRSSGLRTVGIKFQSDISPTIFLTVPPLGFMRHC